jgi:predicted secreted protein
VDGELAGQACTEIYGGPDTATVIGSIGGIDVDTSFHRANGCGIADWELLQALLGRPRWDGDDRVLQRDDAAIELHIGDRFSVELSSNATTGYAWQASFDDAVVRAVGHRYAPPPTNLIGAGGYERFTFEALATGDAALALAYRRPSEPDVVAVDTAEFDVRIAPSSDNTSSAPTSDTSSAPTSADVASSTEPTTDPTTGGQPEAPWAAMPANAAGGELTRFVDAARALHDGLQPLILEASVLPVGQMSPPAVAQHATGARDEFFDLPTMIPVGLQPDVRTAAVDVVFALAREMAPFLYAPGWESDGWDVWSSRIEDAGVDVPQTVARLAEVATAHPDLAATDRVGADTASFQGGLHVLLVRGFGHQNFTTQPPWSVRWIGGLPANPADTMCSLDGRLWTDGSFVDQRGGCAMLYYDTADPSTHDAELATWLLDPAEPPMFLGEIITIRWLNGEWIAEGSAE